MNEKMKGLQIVLVRPEKSGNIGAICRAMKNMGVSRLVIVDPPEIDHERIRTLAVHSYDIFEGCVYSTDLASVTAASGMSAGITRRKGKFRKYAWFSPRELASLAFEKGLPDLALVFGNERTGLTNEELACCSMAVTIPANPDFPSLNLSHAVQIVLYELYREATAAKKNGHFGVSQGQAQELAEIIADEFSRIGFFTLTGKEDTASFFRDIFSRARLSEKETARVKKIFKKMADLKLHRPTTGYRQTGAAP